MISKIFVFISVFSVLGLAQKATQKQTQYVTNSITVDTKAIQGIANNWKQWYTEAASNWTQAHSQFEASLQKVWYQAQQAVDASFESQISPIAD